MQRVLRRDTMTTGVLRPAARAGCRPGVILPVFLYSETVLQTCAPRTSPQCRTTFDCPQAFLSLDCQFRDNVVELKQTFEV